MSVVDAIEKAMARLIRVEAMALGSASRMSAISLDCWAAGKISGPLAGLATHAGGDLAAY